MPRSLEVLRDGSRLDAPAPMMQYLWVASEIGHERNTPMCLIRPKLWLPWPGSMRWAVRHIDMPRVSAATLPRALCMRGPSPSSVGASRHVLGKFRRTRGAGVGGFPLRWRRMAESSPARDGRFP